MDIKKKLIILTFLVMLLTCQLYTYLGMVCFYISCVVYFVCLGTLLKEL